MRHIQKVTTLPHGVISYLGMRITMLFEQGQKPAAACRCVWLLASHGMFRMSQKYAVTIKSQTKLDGSPLGLGCDLRLRRCFII